MFKIETGIDLVEIARLSELEEHIRRRFNARVFTEAELAESENRNEHLAGLFAAKEAAAKALGTGIGEVHWQDLEVLKDKAGKPHLHLHNTAKQLAQQNGWVSWSVSITHTASTAAAVVTALLATQDQG
jgi:holo-[acyl-carrier protein] synthase